MLTEKEFRDEYIKHVRNIMDAYGIKQVELAKVSELTETTISRYLNGLRKPTAYNAYKIDYALNRLKDIRCKQARADMDAELMAEEENIFFFGEDKGEKDDEWGLFW